MGTVQKQVEKVCEDICDNYCRFREQCDSEDTSERVNDGKGCPLDKLHEMFG